MYTPIYMLFRLDPGTDFAGYKLFLAGASSDLRRIRIDYHILLSCEPDAKVFCIEWTPTNGIRHVTLVDPTATHADYCRKFQGMDEYLEKGIIAGIVDYETKIRNTEVKEMPF